MDLVTCPHCGTEIDITGYAPGSRLACGSCNGEFLTPAAAAPVATGPTGARGGPGERGGRRGRAGGRAGQRGGARGGRRERIPDLLVPSILATIFCCLVGGIVAIVYSAQANSHRQAGNFGAAARAAGNAKGWLIASVVIGLVVNLLYIFLVLGSEAF